MLTLLSVLVLTGCTTGNKPTQATHPFLLDSRALETQANKSIRLGNYQQAARLLQRSYAAYASIDDQPSMARQLINQAQVALIVENLSLARASIEALKIHVEQNQQAELKPRWALLAANLAIAEQRWDAALDLLDGLASDDRATQDAAAISRDIAAWNLKQDEQVISSRMEELAAPLAKARLARLKAEAAVQAEQLGQAQRSLSVAKQYYRESAFAPGIAECLVIQARLLERQGEQRAAQNTRAQAKTIFLRLGNQRAIERYQL